MSFSDEVVAGLREEYRTRFGKHKPTAEYRDMAEHSGVQAGFVPSASERQASEIRKSAGVTDPLFCDSSGAPGPRKPGYEWIDQACDESGLPVAGVPLGALKQYDEYFDRPAPGSVSKVTVDALERSRRMATAEYVTKDSGQRDVFDTGCQRDLGEGKGAYDLIPVRPLRRLAQLYERGAKKYDDHNWRKGMPFGRVIQSMIRHAEQFKECTDCDDGEDHLAAVAWNAFTLMEYVEAISKGQLPAELDDRFRYKPPCTER